MTALPQVSYVVFAAAVLGVLTPIVFILVNHDVRIRRIRLIEEFRRLFFRKSYVRSDGREQAFNPERSPSFEFVVTKYVVDLLGLCEATEFSRKCANFGSGDDSSGLYELVAKARVFKIAANRTLLFAFVPYGIAVACSVFLVVEPPQGALMQVLSTIGGPHALLLLQAGLLGAYFFTIRQLMRAVTNFDLTASTAVRAFGHFLETVVVTTFIAVLAQGVTDWGGKIPADTAAAAAAATVAATPAAASVVGAVAAATRDHAPLALVFLAFLAGLIPGAGTELVYTIGRQLLTLPWLSTVFQIIKRTDNRFNSLVDSVPLDVIDGIDFSTRYRLEEVGMYEVENLATANPILLHIETPYGIYEVIDWVAQAQLCTIVGLERFMLLRQFNIRTIFDLERFVQSRQSTHQIRRIVGSILFDPSSRFGEVMVAAGRATRPIRVIGDEKEGAPLEQVIGRMMAEAADTQIAARSSASTTAGDGATVWQPATNMLDASILHAVRTILDDLHVHRLREIWERIAVSLGRDAEHLDDNIDAKDKWFRDVRPSKYPGDDPDYVI